MMIRWRENKSNKKRERQNKTQSCRTFESWLWVQKAFVLESSRKQKHRQMSCSVHVLFLWLFKKHRTILFSSCWSFLVPESFVSVLKASQRSAADESTLYFLTSVFFSWEAVWLTAHLRLEDSRPLNEHNTTVCSSPSVTSCRWLDVLLQLEEGGGGGGGWRWWRVCAVCIQPCWEDNGKAKSIITSLHAALHTRLPPDRCQKTERTPSIWRCGSGLIFSFIKKKSAMFLLLQCLYDGLQSSCKQHVKHRQHAARGRPRVGSEPAQSRRDGRNQQSSVSLRRAERLFGFLYWSFSILVITLDTLQYFVVVLNSSIIFSLE